MELCEPFSYSVYVAQMRMEECVLSSFIRDVADLFGPTLAKVSVADWLDEAELIDCPPLSVSRDWRAVTIVVSAGIPNPMTTKLLNHGSAACRWSFDSCTGLMTTISSGPPTNKQVERDVG